MLVLGSTTMATKRLLLEDSKSQQVTSFYIPLTYGNVLVTVIPRFSDLDRLDNGKNTVISHGELHEPWM